MLSHIWTFAKISKSEESLVINDRSFYGLHEPVVKKFYKQRAVSGLRHKSGFGKIIFLTS